MRQLSFADFNNKHAQETACIVGRGPTRFDYRDLRNIEGPVLFINDAVALEKHLDVGHPSYFFALDRKMCVWFPEILSIAVLPVDHMGAKNRIKILAGSDDLILDTAGDVILWKTKGIRREQMLQADRRTVEQQGQLITGVGSIHSAMHFAWYLGCLRVQCIGCDGINQKKAFRNCEDAQVGYDKRLPNRSGTRPWWMYHRIKRGQEKLASKLSLEIEYLGTPTVEFTQE